MFAVALSCLVVPVLLFLIVLSLLYVAQELLSLDAQVQSDSPDTLDSLEILHSKPPSQTLGRNTKRKRASHSRTQSLKQNPTSPAGGREASLRTLERLLFPRTRGFAKLFSMFSNVRPKDKTQNSQTFELPRRSTDA